MHATMDEGKQRLHDLRQVCFHEAGHHLAALHFGIPATASIRYVGAATFPSRAYTGAVRPLAPTTKFRTAVICWAGPLAEAAADETSPRDCLEDPGWIDFLLDWIGTGEDMSDSDRAGMFGHRQVRRAAMTAARILAKKFEDLQAFATLLQDTAP